jgi:hypothetical protein
LRAAALARAQHFQAVTIDPALPAVRGIATDPEHPAGMTDRRLRGQREKLQAIAEQHVILRHRDGSFGWHLGA